MLRDTYTSDQLVELAHTQPQLWPQIMAHPACSDSLKEWIKSRDSYARNKAKTHVLFGLVAGVGTIFFALMVAAMAL